MPSGTLAGILGYVHALPNRFTEDQLPLFDLDCDPSLHLIAKRATLQPSAGAAAQRQHVGSIYPKNVAHLKRERLVAGVSRLTL